MAQEWVTPPGTLTTRAELQTQYGGALYGGIESSTTTPNVLLFSDPSRGKTYGYNFDGWNGDGTVFLYTGEGRYGDQLMQAGNRSILQHAVTARALRLFVAEGFTKGTRQRVHRYVGEFEVDLSMPYAQAEAPDASGDQRKLFVFRLRPRGDGVIHTPDKSVADDAPRETHAELVAPEAHQTMTFAQPGTAPTTAEKRETELTERFIEHLRSQGRTVRRWRIRPAGELRDLFTDVFDETGNELYEAKGTSTRDAIRRSIGQLFDYRRYIKRPALRISILLPTRPSADLLDLLRELDIGCVFAGDHGRFERARTTSERDASSV